VFAIDVTVENWDWLQNSCLLNSIKMLLNMLFDFDPIELLLDWRIPLKDRL
jgi:hypothetical protein